MSPRHRKCVIDRCDKKISFKQYFCKDHLKNMPSDLRCEFLGSYARGSGIRVLACVNQAKEHFKRLDENKMVSGKSDIVDVSLEYRKENGQAVAFFQGDYETDKYGEQTETWIWLPKSQIEIDGEEVSGKMVEVSMPEWLAKSKGLI